MSNQPAISSAAASSLAQCALRLEDPKFFKRVAGLGATALSMRDLPSRETIAKYSTRIPTPFMPRPEKRVPEGYRVMNQEMIETAARMAPTHSRRQIATALGCSYSTVAYALKKLGLKAKVDMPPKWHEQMAAKKRSVA